MSRYKQIIDGVGFAMPSGEVFRFACCDCGLVHDMVLVSEDEKPIGVAARRSNRATAQRRRRHATAAEIVSATPLPQRELDSNSMRTG
jgi:hypothetical protein